MQSVNDIANAFYGTCKGKLTISETAVYWSLVSIWNHHQRPDGISVSRQEAMVYAGIKDKHAFDKARKGLEEKGLIKSISQGRTSPRKFFICDYSTRGINTLVDSQTRGIIPLDKNKTRGVNTLVDTKTKDTRGINTLALGGKTPQTRGLNAPITETELNRDIQRGDKIQSTNLEGIASPEKKPPSLPEEILTAYQSKFWALGGEDAAALAVLTEEYGTRKMLKVIERAADRHNGKISYIRGILNNWDDDNDWRNTNVRQFPSGAGKNPRQRSKKLTTEWGHETSGWD